MGAPYIYIYDISRLRVKTVNACYYWVQNFVFSSLQLEKKRITTRPWRNAILLVFWYGCENWGLILEEERRMGVFENRALRKMSGPKKNEVKGKWIKPHNEKICDLYHSPYIIRIIISRRMRWLGM